MIKIEEVHFNHDTNSVTNDALNIRLNERPGPAISSPEWQVDNTTGAIVRSAIAYAAHEIGSELNIKAKFSGGSPGQALTIKVVSEDTTRDILGHSCEEEIVFGQNGEVFERFILTGHKLNQPIVDIYEASLFWQYFNGTQWITFGETSHRIYLTLKAPSAPWGLMLNENGLDNTQLPWASALEIACRLAKGATNEDEVVQKITGAINQSPQLMYDGTPSLTDSFFNLSFLLKLLIEWKSKFPVNCTDCAYAVLVMSNLLGCDLTVLYLYQKTAFYTNYVLLLGRDHCEFWHPFVMHSLASKGSQVWDATLQLGKISTMQPNVCNVELPVKMDIVEYMEKLIFALVPTRIDTDRRILPLK